MLPEDRCGNVTAPGHLSLMTVTISAVLCLLTVPGNLLVNLAVFKDPYKDLRSSFTLFIVHLASADLIVGVVTEPISVYIHVRESLGLPIQCAWLIHMSYFISCTASVLSLGALTVDRYNAITNPLNYRNQQGSRRAKFASLSIWIISFSLPFIYFQVGYIVYTFVFANTAIALTFITLVTVLVRVSRRSRACHATDQRTSVARKKMILRERRITKTFVFVLVAFVACYFPSCVIIYIMNFCTSCDCLTIHWLRDIQFLFILLNSFVNPLIYVWRLPSFRRSFVAMATLHCSHGD